MFISSNVREILSYYEADNPGTKKNLAHLLMHGKLGGTGKMIILPIDQGFEHGPFQSFSQNLEALDPHYHYKLAIEAELSAYAAPLGWLEAGADTFAGAIPTILKMNSGNTLYTHMPDQAITASVQDALRLGCCAIGFTIYPGSNASLNMFEEIRELAAQAKSYGLAVVIWSYPRGSMSKEGERAIDIIAYGAHMAALLGAHIIKVKLPLNHFENVLLKEQYQRNGIKTETLQERVQHIVHSCFNGRRLVVFSGGETQSTQDIFAQAEAIAAGKGNGSIIGRNCFQRTRKEALSLLEGLINIYKNNH